MREKSHPKNYHSILRTICWKEIIFYAKIYVFMALVFCFVLFLGGFFGGIGLELGAWTWGLWGRSSTAWSMPPPLFILVSLEIVHTFCSGLSGLQSSYLCFPAHIGWHVLATGSSYWLRIYLELSLSCCPLDLSLPNSYDYMHDSLEPGYSLEHELSLMSQKCIANLWIKKLPPLFSTMSLGFSFDI
jgi:hypothetical protein